MSQTSPRKVLITGASGFVGTNLVRRLLKDGHEICAFLRQESNTFRIDDIKGEIDTKTVQLSDYESLAATVKEIQPDWIFHLAVHGAYSWQNDWSRIVETNMLGTINLLEACAQSGFESFVNTGSSSEYGFCDHAPSESEPVEPNSYYAITKASATMACRFLASSRKLNIPTLRLYSVYGPYEDCNRLMPTLVREGMNGKLPPLVDPDIARDYVYVDDVVDAYLAAATRKAAEPGAVFNVGTGVQTSISEIVDVAIKRFDIKQEPSWGSMNNRKWDSSVWVANVEKIASELGWKASTDVENGFSEFTRWISSTDSLKRYYSVPVIVD